MSKIDHVAQGKANRRKGAVFELKVRKDLMSKGYIVSKWGNNIKDDKCIPAKPGPFRMMQTGFPDFVAYMPCGTHYRVIFVECKTNKYLKPEEKAKAQWYLDHNYCSCFYVAFKNKEGAVEYKKLQTAELAHLH